MPTAYSYIRFSTPAQEWGDSYRRQTEATRRYCEGHGLTLDETVFADKGVSGFKGANATEGRLKAFLTACENGTIKSGSFLIIENLDRLSRDQVGNALPLWMSILTYGVTIVTLSPEEVYPPSSANDLAKLLLGIISMWRAHEDSRLKGDRCGKAWEEKQNQARIAKTIATKTAPMWLTVNGGKFKVKPGAAKTIERIFRLSIDGLGQHGIARKLNAEKVPNFGKLGQWCVGTIGKILANRAVLGEYQPFCGRTGKRVAVGEPIADYFPRIIADDLFYRAEKSRKHRLTIPKGLTKGKTKRNAVPAFKRKADRCTNIFSGLLWSMDDGGPMHYIDKGQGYKPAIVSYKATRGIPGAKYVTFPYERLEQGILFTLREIKPEQLFPAIKAATCNVELLEGELVAIDGRIAKIKKRLMADSGIDSLIDVIKELSDNRKAILAKIEIAKAENAQASQANWVAQRNLIDTLEANPDNVDCRFKLRQLLRENIKRIDIKISSLSERIEKINRKAIVNITFLDGRSENVSRALAIVHKKNAPLFVRSLDVPKNCGELTEDCVSTHVRIKVS